MDVLLELMKSNFEDAHDHLHAKTYQREANERRAWSKGKILNIHERKYENTRKYLFTIE